MIAPGGTQGSAWLLERVTARFGDDLSGRILAGWGMFGESVGGMRAGSRSAIPFEFAEATTLELVETLLERGARIKAHATPTDAERERFGDRIHFCDAGYRCLIGADALLVHGNAKPYRRPDFHRIMVLLQSPLIFDDRALYPLERMRELGFEYHSVGREPVIPAGRAAPTTQIMTGAPRASGSVGPIVATKDGPLSAGPAPG
jgi:UDPglucose 6-dehydrogenase